MDFFITHISTNAGERISNLLHSTYLSEGKLVAEFENRLSKNAGLINPIALNSGTSALHLALDVAGIKDDDEVITSPQTFIATGLAILQQKAKPVFSDIQIETGNIDPISVAKKITEKTKAILIVHWAGYPCDIDEIHSIAKANNLIVIEDAAHALGATYKGNFIGSLSDFTCFSFQAIKHITTGDGGALCCIKETDFEKAKAKRWFGIDRNRSKVSLLGERDYDLKEIGYKYHMNDYSAALGLANMDDFETILKRRRAIAEEYNKHLSNISGLTLLNYMPDRESSYWLYNFLVEDRTGFIRKLKTNGIPSSVVHMRIDKNSVFGGLTPGLYNQERFNEKQISIPVHSHLSDKEVELIINTIKNGW